MSQGVNLLQHVYRNAEMGRGTIPQVMQVSADPALRSILGDQLREYERISRQTGQILEQRGSPPQGSGEMRDFVSGVMIRMKTLTDKSASHIAEMMIQGSTMGTIQMTRQLHSCEAADGEALALALRLLRTEENNIAQMKRFL